MNVQVTVRSLIQEDVFSVAQGGALTKGGKKANLAIWSACEKVTDRFCCYYWKDNASIRYVGSVTANYSAKQYKTNVTGRISQYLQNHSGTTNKMVFDKVNITLATSPVCLGVFRFSQLSFDENNYPYDECSNSPRLIQMLEEILICRFRLLNQAAWNRK